MGIFKRMLSCGWATPPKDSQDADTFRNCDQHKVSRPPPTASPKLAREKKKKKKTAGSHQDTCQDQDQARDQAQVPPTAPASAPCAQPELPEARVPPEGILSTAQLAALYPGVIDSCYLDHGYSGTVYFTHIRLPGGGVKKLVLKVCYAKDKVDDLLLRKEGRAHRLCTGIPFVIPLEDYKEPAQDGDPHIFVMSVSHTGSLFDRMEDMRLGNKGLRLGSYKEPFMSTAQLKLLITQLLVAVLHLHKRGITHADIKEKNILINDKDGSVLLADFGAATFDGVPNLRDMKTDDYVHPSAFDGAFQNVIGHPHWTWDIHAIGIILHQLLWGFMSDDLRGHVLRGTGSDKVLAKLTPEEASFLQGLLHHDPTKVFTALQALAHPYLASCLLAQSYLAAARQEEQGSPTAPSQCSPSAPSQCSPSAPPPQLPLPPASSLTLSPQVQEAEEHEAWASSSDCTEAPVAELGAASEDSACIELQPDSPHALPACACEAAEEEATCSAEACAEVSASAVDVALVAPGDYVCPRVTPDAPHTLTASAPALHTSLDGAGLGDSDLALAPAADPFPAAPAPSPAAAPASGPHRAAKRGWWGRLKDKLRQM